MALLEELRRAAQRPAENILQLMSAVIAPVSVKPPNTQSSRYPLRYPSSRAEIEEAKAAKQNVLRSDSRRISLQQCVPTTCAARNGRCTPGNIIRHAYGSLSPIQRWQDHSSFRCCVWSASSFLRMLPPPLSQRSHICVAHCQRRGTQNLSTTFLAVKVRLHTRQEKRTRTTRGLKACVIAVRRGVGGGQVLLHGCYCAV